MGTEPVYICSGADRIAKVPELHIEAILFNAPALLQGNAAAINASEVIATKNIAMTILDSGGKQIHEVNTGKSKRWLKFEPNSLNPLCIGKTLHLAPAHLSEAIKRLPGVAICMALDDPVLPSKYPNICNKNFHEKIRRNTDFAIKTVEIRNANHPNVEIFLPMQCQTVLQFEHYWEKLQSVGLDGISIPARCFKKLEKLIPFVVRFRELNIQKVHILGTSNLNTIALLSFLARNGHFAHLAFDSTTWLAAANHGLIVMPYSLKNIKISDERHKEAIAALIEFDPIYSEYDLEDFHLLSNIEQTKHLRTLNYWAIMKTKREIFANAGSAESLCTFLEAQDVHESDISNVHSLLNNMS
jgi:hypothetical protein